MHKFVSLAIMMILLPYFVAGQQGESAMNLFMNFLTTVFAITPGNDEIMISRKQIYASLGRFCL